MTQTTGLDSKLKDVAERIRELREISGIGVSNMAQITDLTEEEYLLCENGEADLTFAFIYRCAMAFGVDVTDIIEGHSPKLRSYTVTRKGCGQRIEEAHGMVYYNLASDFRNRIAEPLLVYHTYNPGDELKPIELTTHTGQECDIIVSGKLKVQVGSHTEILSEGDSIYYDSSTPHGMVAVDGGCYFYAIVLNPSENQGTNEITTVTDTSVSLPEDDRNEAWRKFVSVTKNDNGLPEKITFKDADKFNFAYDIVDDIARREPEKLALLHIDSKGNERRFTFREIKRESNRAANYFTTLGIKKGDRVMLVLRRHYQFWIAAIALHKIGAIAIPAVAQLQKHDFEYRFKAAGVSMIISAEGEVTNQIDAAIESCDMPIIKLIAGGEKEGWRSFDNEYHVFSSHFDKPNEIPCGDDIMLMFFTSGTTGYPKIAAHSYKYALGHFHTAKYWQCAERDGLHLTISDTGWAKSAWGKLYGQWLCESALFVYDFNRFDASVILPMFKKYNITSFCAPPTMLRMMVKEDISKYDLSSVKNMTTAGEALNAEVYRQFYKATGLKIRDGFGQTETTMVIGNLRGDTHKIGSMGKPAPIYDIALLDKDDKPVKIGETGEICINTENGAPCGLFLGYYGDDNKTSESWHDGYYHTGDLAWMDEDGFYWYVGRADDVIKSSGYRIGPFEIESVIMELPYVLECGVCAAPDEVRGQVVKAVIVLTKGMLPSEALKKEIQDYVKKNTAPYKYPRIVEFRDSLPKTVSGKIQRSQLQ